jgi:DNA-binding XRE family transcriptional regulator
MRTIEDTHKVFNQETFLQGFLSDLASARGLVLIQSPFVTVRRVDQLRPYILSCIRRGVRVCAFIQRTFASDAEPARERAAAVNSAVELLSSYGVHITTRDLIHEKLAIIDEKIFWEGSLNILSHSNTSERMTRWQSRGKVMEAINSHNLGLCDACTTRFGKLVVFDDVWVHRQRLIIGSSIAKRRKQLGVSQKELAERSGVKQSAISGIEMGKRDVQLSTLLRLGRELGIGLRVLDWYLLPAVDERIGVE